MEKSEARNAIKHIRRNLEKALKQHNHDDAMNTVLDVLSDVMTIEARLDEVKKPQPNCRRATPEELETLCHASNVVMFPAVA